MLRITVPSPSVQWEEIINWFRRDLKDQLMLLNFSVVPRNGSYECNYNFMLSSSPLQVFLRYKYKKIEDQRKL